MGLDGLQGVLKRAGEHAYQHAYQHAVGGEGWRCERGRPLSSDMRVGRGVQGEAGVGGGVGVPVRRQGQAGGGEARRGRGRGARRGRGCRLGLRLVRPCGGELVRPCGGERAARAGEGRRGEAVRVCGRGEPGRGWAVGRRGRCGAVGHVHLSSRSHPSPPCPAPPCSSLAPARAVCPPRQPPRSWLPWTRQTCHAERGATAAAPARSPCPIRPASPEHTPNPPLKL